MSRLAPGPVPGHCATTRRGLYRRAGHVSSERRGGLPFQVFFFVLKVFFLYLILVALQDWFLFSIYGANKRGT